MKPGSKHTAVPSLAAIFWKSCAPYVGLLAVLGVLVAIFGCLSSRFLSMRTVTTIANSIPDLTVIAVGMTLVLIVGGIDLSVGSMLALSSAVLGVLMVDYDWSFGAAAVVCGLVGIVVGTVNGVISIGARIPSFIVTLGMLEVARGAAYLLTDSQTKYIGSSVEWLGAPVFSTGGFSVSPSFLLAMAVVLGGQFLLTRTVVGRYWVAIGTNAEAVRMSGIDARPYAVSVFAISGLMCALAGLMQTSRLSSADPNAAVGLELAAIAAAVIGGTSLMGGRGSVIHTFFGVLVIAVLQTGLAHVGASEPVKRLLTGGVIVLAVLVDAYRNQLRGGVVGAMRRLVRRAT